MGARRITALALGAALLLAAPAWSQVGDVVRVLFLVDAGQNIELKGERAFAFDQADKPLFQGDLAYIRGYAENPTGRVYEWAPVGSRVRITPDGQPAVWLKCSELKPMTIACGQPLQFQGAVVFVGDGDIPQAYRPAAAATPRPRPKPAAPRPSASASPYGSIDHGSGTGHGSGYGAGPGLGRGVPICPGDVRCRKVKPQ